MDTEEPPAPPETPSTWKSCPKRCFEYLCVTTPKAVYFLLVNITLENFAAYGILAVIMIYLKEELGLPQVMAKTIYHFTQFAVVLFPVIGGFLSDFYVGKFLLIVPLDWLWMIVYTILAFTSYTPFGLTQAQQRDFAISCLVISKLRSLSTPSIVAFPGDQYEETETKTRDDFYYALYFAVNLGAMMANLIVPRFRSDVHCIRNSENCFPAAFGFPVGISLVATAFLFGGLPFYKLLPPAREQNWKLLKCFGYGVYRTCRSWFRHKRSHWMDLADDKYTETDVAEVKAVLGVVVLFTAFPMFWALFDQQPSLWTMMSSKLDGRTIFGQVLPDQMDAANPALVMALIPVFTGIIYPLLERIKMLRTPLERMGCGFSLGVLSYVIGGILCLFIEENMPSYPDFDKTDIVFHNGFMCDIKVDFANEQFMLKSYQSVERAGITLTKGSQNNPLDGVVEIDKACPLSGIPDLKFTTYATPGYAYSVVFKADKGSANLIHEQGRQNRSRDDQRNSPKMRFIYIGNDIKGREISVFSPALEDCFPLSESLTDDSIYGSGNTMNDESKICYHNKTQDCACDEVIGYYVFGRGGIYDLLIIDHGQSSEFAVFTTAVEDSVPILLQLPMYLILTMGEIMCSVTAYSFAYSESPETTKSIMQSVFYVCVSLGNLIVLVVDWILQPISEEIHPIDPERPQEIPAPSTVFFVYSVLMLLDVVYFIFLARRYDYVNPMYQAIKK